jgi:DNA-binding CsgD family transcriptional regulator
MRSPQPVAVVAIGRRFDMTPACARLLMILYSTRHCRSEARLAHAAGIAVVSVKVYVSNIRSVLGVNAIITEFDEGYTLSDEGRAAVRAGLAEMYAEVAEYLKPHLVAA